MNYCNAPHAPNTGTQQPTSEEMATNIIRFAKDNLKMDLSQYRDEMINAGCRGQLEFSYLGPNNTEQTPSGKDYNCCLTILRKKQYFLLPSVKPIKEPI